MAQFSYQQILLTSDIILQWPFAFTSLPLLLDINDVLPDANGHTITFPDATLAQPGEVVEINNISAFSFTILADDGITTIAVFPAGQIANVQLIDNSTTNGTWRIIPFQSSASGITSFSVQSSDSSINVSTTPGGGTITPPGGSIDVTMLPSLSNLNAVATTGFLTIQSISPLTFQPQELIAGESIVITNPDGVGGEAVINLNTAVGPISSLVVGNMTLSGEVITNDFANGNIQLNSNGTGNVQINGIQIDKNANISGINNLIAPQAWVLFLDTIVVGNVITVQAASNVATVTGGAGSYTITFSLPFSDTNYGVEISLGTHGVAPFPIQLGYWLVKAVDQVSITVVDAAGALVTAAPDGISVSIMHL